MVREAAVAMALVAATLVTSLVLYFVVLPSNQDDHGQTGPPSAAAVESDAQPQQGFSLGPWQPTGKSTVQVAGVDLWIHAFRITHDRISVTYSVESAADFDASGLQVRDESGYAYKTISNAVFGSSFDVSTGVITTEPYTGSGKQLLLELAVGHDSGSVAFLQNNRPGLVDYDTGGGIEPIVQSAGMTFGLASFPGGKFIRVIVERSGEESEFFGYAPDGIARGVSETEFLQLWNAEESFPFDLAAKPPDWPASAAE